MNDPIATGEIRLVFDPLIPVGVTLGVAAPERKETMIYAVTRRYTVEEIVYVEAESKTEARQKAEDSDWIDQTVAETVSPSTYRKADPRPDLTLDHNGDVVPA